MTTPAKRIAIIAQAPTGTAATRPTGHDIDRLEFGARPLGSGNTGAEQMDQKSFQALSHGQEWANFYESFDRLVQDNLNRSSELLRRAMTLPEVADREVSRVKTDYEARLVAERERSKAILVQFGVEVSSSHQQIAKLTRSMGKVADDLARLNARINDALASYDRVDLEGVAAMEDALRSEEPSFAEELKAVAAEIEAASNIVAPAQATADGAEGGTAVKAPGTSALGDRPRPHWLSVTRTPNQS